jgi:outer membrane lipoprotein
MFVVIFASSCASPIAKKYRQEAAPGLTFPMVLEDPAAYKGSVVIWGGTIIRTVDNRQAGSDVFVLQSPLGSTDKPEAADYSQGRFIGVSPSFLDPLVYSKGRKITVAGVVAGKREVAEGGRTYAYPVVTVEQLYLWPRYVPYYYGGPYYYDWYAPYWYGPYFWDTGPFWGVPGEPRFREGEEGEHMEGRGEEGGGQERGRR